MMDLSHEILKEYLTASHEISRHLRECCGKLNLTFPQSQVLAILESEGTVPISTLAEETGSANSTISGVVDRLERIGFVRRKRSELDRRVIYVETTEQFDAFRKGAAPTLGNFFGNVFTQCSDEDQEAILKGLKLISGLFSKE